MMMNNNQMINQMNQNQMFQMIQKNNEQIIQMIQQIFQVQMLNNMILNQILTNNLNNNNNINNNMNVIRNQMNNLMNNINMNNNLNMQNMMDNNMMNMINNNNVFDPWEGNTSRRAYIIFEFNSVNRFVLHPPENITVKELIDEFIKKSNLEKQNLTFLFNGTTDLRKYDCKKIGEIFKYGMQVTYKVIVFRNKEVLGTLKNI